MLFRSLDVPAVPEDYIHRVGRTARADLKGEAYTFVAPDEESDLRAIEKAISKRLPRVTVPDFDYSAKPAGRLEIPIGERIAKIRAEKAGQRARAAEKAKRRDGGGPARPGASGSSSSGSSSSRRGGRGGGRSR